MHEMSKNIALFQVNTSFYSILVNDNTRKANESFSNEIYSIFKGIRNYENRAQNNINYINSKIFVQLIINHVRIKE